MSQAQFDQTGFSKGRLTRTGAIRFEGYSAAEFINHNIAPDGATKEGDRLELIRTGRELKFSGTSILVKRPWYRNFGHCLIDLMPILPLLRDAGVEADRIIFGAVPSGPLLTLMERTARTFYRGAELIFADDVEQIRCDRLLYVRPVHVPPLFKHPLAVQRTIEAAKLMFPPSKSGPRSKRIYLSRQKLAARTIANHDVLAALLERNNFETVYPEELGFGEQIARFEFADVIVGVKGAALTNAMFCKPGTHVLALSPSDFVDPFYWDLLAPRGINYSEIFCKVTGNATSPSLASFEASPTAVERFLSKI